jgi:hypothetical protein
VIAVPNIGNKAESMKAHFILFVAAQEKSTAFYSSVLGEAPILNVPGMTEFRLGKRQFWD